MGGTMHMCAHKDTVKTIIEAIKYFSTCVCAPYQTQYVFQNFLKMSVTLCLPAVVTAALAAGTASAQMQHQWVHTARGTGGRKYWNKQWWRTGWMPNILIVFVQVSEVLQRKYLNCHGSPHPLFYLTDIYINIFITYVFQEFLGQWQSVDKNLDVQP